MTVPYPLAWPEKIARSRATETGRFRQTLAGASKNVKESLRLFSQDSGKKIETNTIVVSSNAHLTNMRPTDAGVSVWFVWDGMQICIPVDRYSTVEANLQAIHLIIEARRTELRHGTLALVRASFAGWQMALPAPGSVKRSWREVLGYGAAAALSEAAIKSAYKTAAKKAHPDQGGSHDAMAEVNRAHDEAMKELKP